MAASEFMINANSMNSANEIQCRYWIEFSEIKWIAALISWIQQPFCLLFLIPGIQFLKLACCSWFAEIQCAKFKTKRITKATEAGISC